MIDMLAVLRIQNLAVVEHTEIEFGEGLNVLTGETGAGKTIILKAIELLTGKRAGADIIRSGAEQCTVEGLFVLSARAQQTLSRMSEACAEFTACEELIIRRIIDRSGRSKVYVNGSLSTAALLQELSIPLLDITGQHQQQTLLDPDEHLELLDTFAGLSGLRESIAASFQVFAKARRELESFVTSLREQTLHLQRLKHEAKELSQAKLREGEREELESEVSRLKNFEALTLRLTSALELLEQADDSIEARLHALLSLLKQCQALDSALDEQVSLLESAGAQLEEVRGSITNYLSSLDADPNRLEFLRERIAEIARLERKYQKPSSELLRYLAGIEQEVSDIESGVLSEKTVRERFEKAGQELRAWEEKIRKERTKSARILAERVEQELAGVHMKRARFQVSISPAESSETGADRVEFLLAANVGEQFHALSQAASGGELSRILLVLKCILGKEKNHALQLFDEIDAGIGGAVAQVIGEKLRALGETSQIIIITHAPQIAVFGRHHFLIEKHVVDERTVTSVRLLNEEERVAQIAGMLAGKEVTENFEDSARELLAIASNSRKKASGSQSKKNRTNTATEKAVIQKTNVR